MSWAECSGGAGGRASGRLMPRERDVLGVMAEGKSNQGIAESLFVTEAAVQKHVTNIVHKLALGPTPTGHRRVLAVLADLRELRAR
jgi:DNA-binding NarL/FixJ family response regulator